MQITVSEVSTLKLEQSVKLIKGKRDLQMSLTFYAQLGYFIPVHVETVKRILTRMKLGIPIQR